MNSNAVEMETHVIDGVRHPIFTTVKHIEELQNFEIFEDDVVVMTSPKSGTTWMQEIISMLRYGCDAQKADQEYIENRWMFIDFPSQQPKVFSSTRLIKTHLPPRAIPAQMLAKKAKIIFVSRNPKDTAVSFFYFHKTVKRLPTYDSWNEFLEDFCAGNLVRGDWFDMNSYWWSQRNHKNVLFVKYEDMHRNLSDVAKKVASFLGWTITNKDLPELLKHCSFESMKSNKKVNYTENPRMDTKNVPFMRKGKVGDWKNHFTVAQSEAFDELYREKMAGTGLDFDYEL
ncbi:sulfotransferase 1C2A-like [Anneissia japonica]|uniref:sulfotransferase 1C2A-like n=1 Tax=Anneissia japonica TaxID=1529436 RepID=UPI001425B623|nr:sulfotransferase 1C2A-like [Anneissia japonica]